MTNANKTASEQHYINAKSHLSHSCICAHFIVYREFLMWFLIENRLTYHTTEATEMHEERNARNMSRVLSK